MLSPLLNAFEAAHARDIAGAGIDASAICVGFSGASFGKSGSFEAVCGGTPTEDRVRVALNDASIALLEASVETVETALLRRLAKLTARHRNSMRDADLVIDNCIVERARDTKAIGPPVSVSVA